MIKLYSISQIEYYFFIIIIIKDIINKLGSQKFSRLKIGISNDKAVDTKDYVLGKFSNDEIKILNNSYEKLYDLVEDFISYDVNALKQIYNNKNN